MVELNLYIKVICLLCASLVATHALSQDISGWSDKTICRLVESDGGAAYLEEVTMRGIDCELPTIIVANRNQSDKNLWSKNIPPSSLYLFDNWLQYQTKLMKAVCKKNPNNPSCFSDGSGPKIVKPIDSSKARINVDQWSIPSWSNPPNLETLLYYFYRYTEGHQNGDPEIYQWSKYEVQPSNKKMQLISDSKSVPFVTKQLQNKAILSYLFFEKGKITVDEISPPNKFGNFISEDTKLRSNSVGKSLASYVLGHAICEGLIDSEEAIIDDWPLLKGTLYEGQKLIDLLNMTSGDQKYVYDSNFLRSGLRNRSNDTEVDTKTIRTQMLGFQNTSASKKRIYNYNVVNTFLILNYVLFKAGVDFEQLLYRMFSEKIGIEKSVYFFKHKGARANGNMNNMFFASRHDYLRIAVSILNDWQSDNCVGQYLKRIYNKRTPKNLSLQKDRSEPAYGNSKSYGGQFHLDYRGLQNRKVIGMSGFGGQSILIDTESSRIVVLHSVHYNYDHIGLLINPIKKGFVETNLNDDGQYDTFPPTFVKNDNDEVINLEANRVLFGSSADGSIMFSEDFEIEGQRAIRVDERDNKWYIKQDDNGNSIYCNKATDDWTHFKFGSADWSNYSISYRMKFLAGKGGQTQTHIRKTNNGEYRANIGSYGGIEIQFLLPRPENFPKKLARGFVSTRTGEWLDIQLTASGDNIKYLVDGEVVASAIDDRLKKGSGLFAVSANSEVCIDDIVVNKM